MGEDLQVYVIPHIENSLLVENKNCILVRERTGMCIYYICVYISHNDDPSELLQKI